MSYESSHVNMLESDISGKCGLTFRSISWDAVEKQYVMVIRVHYKSNYRALETIYLDFETISLLYKRHPEVISLLNNFNNHQIKPLRNNYGAFRLSQVALHPRDRNKWGACEFDDPYP